MRPRLNLELMSFTFGQRDIAAGGILSPPACSAIAVDNSLWSAARHVMAFDCEGAFRSCLVRLAIDESLAILHGRTTSGHRQVYLTPVANKGDLAGSLTAVSVELIESASLCEEKQPRIEDNATQ